MKNQALFDKLSQSETNLFSGATEFLSPAYGNKPIKIRLDGVIMSFTILPKGYAGWGIFKAKNLTTAQFVRPASLMEREAYLNLYPKFDAIIYEQGKQPRAVIKSKNKNTVVDGEVNICLGENLNQFDWISARWDGNNFWYDSHSVSMNVNLSNMDYLRESLSNKVKPENLSTKGISPAELRSYELAFETVKDKTKDRLENALRRSGGKLVRYVDRNSTYTVTYKVRSANGTESEYTSTVNSDLRVEVAGVCLSGGDKNFDLQSLVHVLREGERRDLIVPNGYHGDYDDNDDDY